jgi:hypothetical protein
MVGVFAFFAHQTGDDQHEHANVLA